MLFLLLYVFLDCRFIQTNYTHIAAICPKLSVEANNDVETQKAPSPSLNNKKRVKKLQSCLVVRQIYKPHTHINFTIQKKMHRPHILWGKYNFTENKLNSKEKSVYVLFLLLSGVAPGMLIKAGT